MISILRCRLVALLATILALPARGAEKLPTHPKLVYRQIGAGFTLALETGRREKAFFFCLPGKTDCVSTSEIGWRKPFIIIRSGSLIGRDYNVIDTTGARHSESANYLNPCLVIRRRSPGRS